MLHIDTNMLCAAIRETDIGNVSPITNIPLQSGLVPFQVRSLVQMRVEARSASMVKPGEHWKLTVWL